MDKRQEEIEVYFRELDRSFFMDTDKASADLNKAISIGHGQTISQPSLVLDMTIQLDLQPDSKVLEIGTGSGFQTALLAAFSKEVYTVERIEELHVRAQEWLTEAGYTNIQFKLGDGSEGWEEHAPYDRIMVTAAAAEVPAELISQLAIGGKMVIPVGSGLNQDLLLIEKDAAEETATTVLEPVMFVPLKGKYE